MSTIDENSSVLTLINVFTVEPEKQQKLVALLIEATQKTMKHSPGFVSANIHRSLDGKRDVNYAQWKDMAAFEACARIPRRLRTCGPPPRWCNSNRSCAKSRTQLALTR